MKLLKHDRDKVGDFQRRALMHIPIGLLIGVPIFGAPLGRLFEKYELNEDAHTKDEAWKDLYGALIGASLTTIASAVIIGLVIWKFISG